MSSNWKGNKMPLGEVNQERCAARAAYLAYKLIMEYIEVHASNNTKEEIADMSMRAVEGASLAMIGTIWGKNVAEGMLDSVYGMTGRANVVAASLN